MTAQQQDPINSGRQVYSEQTLRALGVVFHDPPLAPVRVLSRVDGKDCWVFSSEKARQEAIGRCQAVVGGNCTEAARSGCSLRALDECRGPAWLRWIPFARRRDASSLKEVEACEARIMEGCMAAAGDSCQQHAAEFCPKSHPKLLCID